MVLVAALGCGKPRTISAYAISPDGKLRALLVEKDDGRIDRNFDVMLEVVEQPSVPRRLIFSSPDEGRPIGTERFLWSKDSQHLLLVGKQFGVPKASSVGDELLYLLLDLNPEHMRCNARQQNTHVPFTAKSLSSIEWTDESFQKELRRELKWIEEREK